MDKSYWEKIAPSYDSEIFDVLHHDKRNIISSVITKIASKNKTVIDIGCAIGKWIPLLSPRFKKVFAIDISVKNLERAKSNNSSYKNVEYIRINMSNGKSKIPQCDFAICINAILTADLQKRISFFSSMSKALKNGGHIILTVPSLESSMLTSIISNQFNIDKNILHKKRSMAITSRQWNNIRQGNVEIDNIPTKHYLKEELQYLLKNEGFRIIKTEKIEYDWKTEFNNPPRWLNDPYPWDWMVLAQKIK
ncbi:MAG: class I SAM-dependent methyltransferase [Bacteroidetes bacterium]|nr:class I SAM-dependent methyltransferase [Bacteroidota bacterium]MBS1931819.1 class I SAM-dependent methyltransferase [Bacteroidota bacterium]